MYIHTYIYIYIYKSEVRQELLWLSFCTNGINSCLSYCLFSRMCSCSYGGKNLFVGMSASENSKSAQARTDREDTRCTAHGGVVSLSLYNKKKTLFLNVVHSCRHLTDSAAITLTRSGTVETAHLFATFPPTGCFPQVRAQQGSTFTGSRAEVAPA